AWRGPPAAALLWAAASGPASGPDAPGGDRLDDHLPVEATVLDEDAARLPPRDHRPRDVEAGDVALQRGRVVVGLERGFIDPHARPPEEIDIGMIAGEEEEALGGELVPPTRALHENAVGEDLQDPGLEAGGHRALLDPVLD